MTKKSFSLHVMFLYGLKTYYMSVPHHLPMDISFLKLLIVALIILFNSVFHI